MNNAIDGVAQQLPKYTVKDLDASLCPNRLQWAIKEMISNLEKVLSDPIIKYDITFSKKSYSFKEPLDDQEKAFYAKQRQQLIKAMLKKAINKFIDNHYQYQDDEDYNDTSFDFIQYLITMHPTNLIIDQIVGEEYEVKVEDLNRNLDLEGVEDEDFVPGFTSTKAGDLILKEPKHCKCWFKEIEATQTCDGNCVEKAKS